MARPSPSAQRIISMLNFFADNPGQAFSLTDLIRALKINRATCHGLLAELVNASYLYRTNDKLYVLGPAVARLGQAVDVHLSPLQVALPEMRVLADEHDAICMALFRDRNDVVVRERVASVSHLDWPVSRGTRWPLRPPFGAIFLAWSSPDEAETWLDELEPPPSLAERQMTREGMEFVRKRGFQFFVQSAPGQPTQEIAEWLFIPDPAERPIQSGTELQSHRTYHLASMSTPVFDERGRVAFVLGLSGFSKPYTGAQIDRISTQLDRACQRVMKAFPRLEDSHLSSD